MLYLGNHPSEVAEVLAVSLATLYNWRVRWREEDLERLANRDHDATESAAKSLFAAPSRRFTLPT